MGEAISPLRNFSSLFPGRNVDVRSTSQTGIIKKRGAPGGWLWIQYPVVTEAGCVRIAYSLKEADPQYAQCAIFFSFRVNRSLR